jgi:hypothetical protein
MGREELRVRMIVFAWRLSAYAGEGKIIFADMPNVEIAAMCDIDDSVMSERLAQVRKMGFQPKT